MGEEHECCKLSNWFPNSTHLYLEFHLWSIYIQKIKEQIRKICYKLPRSRKPREVKTPHCKRWNYQMNPAIRSSWKHRDITFWQPHPLCAAQTFYPICSNYVGGTHREKPTATQFLRLLFSMTQIFEPLLSSVQNVIQSLQRVAASSMLWKQHNLQQLLSIWHGLDPSLRLV